MSILLFLLGLIIGLVLLVGAAFVVFTLVVGVIKYTLNPRALITDLKADIQRRLS